jgi:hypothetical protein
MQLCLLVLWMKEISQRLIWIERNDHRAFKTRGHIGKCGGECPYFKKKLKQLRSGQGFLGIASNDPAGLFNILENK